jgi:hypothetical protein
MEESVSEEKAEEKEKGGPKAARTARGGGET